MTGNTGGQTTINTVTFASGKALKVETGGTATIGHVKITQAEGASTDTALVQNSGTLNLVATGYHYAEVAAAGTAIESSGTLNMDSGAISTTSTTAEAVKVTGGTATITDHTDSNGVVIAPASITTPTGSSASAMTVANGATLSLASDLQATISAASNTAVSLASGAKVTVGATSESNGITYTAASSGTSYIDNCGNVVLAAGATKGSDSTALNAAVVLSDGTLMVASDSSTTVAVSYSADSSGNTTSTVTFSGAATVTDADGETSTISSGTSIPVVDGKVSFTAKLTRQNGAVLYFDTLTKAFQNCSASDTVTLLKDATAGGIVNNGTASKITFDLAGHSLTVAEKTTAIEVQRANDFVITDSVGGGTVTGGPAVKVNGNGGKAAVTIAGGTFVGILEGEYNTAKWARVVEAYPKTLASDDVSIAITGGTFKYAENTGATTFSMLDQPVTDTSHVRFSVSGGTFVGYDPATGDDNASQNNASNYVATGYLSAGTDGTYTVSAAVASVTSGETTTCYASLEAAFKAATAGSTINLLVDYTWPYTTQYNVLTLPEGATFDLNEHTLTAANTSLVFEGKGTIKNGTMVAGNQTTSTGGTTVGSYALFIGNNTNGVTTEITVEGVTTYGGVNVFASKAILKNCTVNGSRYYAVWADAGGEVVIESGTYKTNVTPEGNTLDVQAKSVLGLSPNDGAMNVTGGTFVVSDGQTLVLEGSTAGAYNDPEISGGTFSVAVSPKYCADGYQPEANSDSTYGVKALEEGQYLLDKYKGEGTTANDWTYPTSEDGKVFAGWYSDSNLTTAISSETLTGTAYPKFVDAPQASSVITFLGGSLRKDYKDANGDPDYSKTSLRLGYTVNVSSLKASASDVTPTWYWAWGLTNELGYTKQGVEYVAGSGESTLYTTNLVITGIPSSAYSSEVYAELHVGWTTADGTQVSSVVKEAEVKNRSVLDVANSILSSSTAPDTEKAYAQGIKNTQSTTASE